jgi:uncharacterized protein YjbJ (UPF0337 family)
MNKDNFEGAARSTFGHGEQMVGNAFKDPSATVQGRYDEVVGKAQSALGSAKDAVASGVDAASSIDLSGIRDEIARLTQTVTDHIQKQTSTARDQVMDAVGAAGDNISHSAAAAQDKLVSLETDMGARIQKNPWSAVAIAALGGLFVGKMI